MIIEIALGIVLAVVVLAFLPALLTGGFLLLVIALVAGLIALIVFNFRIVGIGLIALCALATLYGVPFLLAGVVSERYPKIGTIIDGKPPYNRLTKFPVRLVVVGVVAIGVSLIAVFSLIAVGHLVDLLDASTSSVSS